MQVVKLFLGAVLAGSLLSSAWAASPEYKIAKTIPLGLPDKWDYLTYEPVSHRVFISHGTEITVVDPDAGAVVGHVEGLSRSHGIVALGDLGVGFADSGDRNDVTIFDLKTLKPIKVLKTDPGPDAVVYDPASKRVFTINGDSSSATAIDAVGQSVVGTVALGGGPEFAAVDGKGKLYINIESNSEIVRVDTNSLKVEARWPIKDCAAPHGLAIDPAAHRLFSTCVNQLMMVVDTQDGHIVASLPIGKGTDAAAFDATRKFAFSSNGDGTLTVVNGADAAHYSALANVKTAPGARTMALDPASGRVFLTTADNANPPDSTAKFAAKPGTAKLLVLDPVP
jgi:YVTN family beta-propeller protein